MYPVMEDQFPSLPRDDIRPPQSMRMPSRYAAAAHGRNTLAP